MEPPSECFRSRVSVHEKNENGEFQSCSGAAAQNLLNAIVKPDSTNFQTMCLREEVLRRRPSGKEVMIEFPWHPRSLASIARNPQDRSLRSKVIFMALDRFCKYSTVEKILHRKGVPIFSIRGNPHLMAGHPPYDNFIKSLVSLFEERSNNQLFEDFLASAAIDIDAWDQSFSALETGGIRTVFHGTNHAVMDAILLTGLNPTLRRGTLSADYFGLDYDTSVYYTVTKTTPYPTFLKLLLFIIILDSLVITTVGAVTVVRTEYELPIAEITVYHSSFKEGNYEQAFGCPLLPLRSHIKGPAPSPAADADGVDVIDESINYFRANVLFRKFEVKSAADKLLIYLTLYINMALKRIEGCKTEADGIKAIVTLGLEKFPIPGEAGFPLGGLLSQPQSREEADLFRSYLKQAREETSGRLLERVYRPNGTPNKWWLAFAKRKFMNIMLPF